MGKTHAEVASRYCHDARLVAIAGGKRAPKLAAEYQVDFEGSVENLLDRDDIDAVIITTPHDCHLPQGLAAAQHGKHILMEKPIGTSLPDIDQLIDACSRAGLNLMTAQTQRYRDGNRVAKSLIDSGAIGRIRMVEEVQHAQLPADISHSTETCGRLLGHGIHSPDRLRWFLEDEAEWVCGFSGNYAIQSPHENSSMTLIQFSRGVMATVWVTFESAPPLFPTSAFHARIIGEKGLLDIDSYGMVKLGTENGWQVMYEQEPFDFQKDPLSPVRLKSFALQDQEFVDSILENRAPAITGGDGRAAVEIVLAAYQSQQTHRMVHIG
ncbi:predicted dehydrogenase [Longilinea arvoryzae]|uniref:Predicted dehydrogenase n=2 Tax=Longilinea arvoryzae TaxID=360412 RepID=A0A0S7BMN3_9CHLR|nr:predicted dehydrogenase [Longilinea arvoryzae]